MKFTDGIQHLLDQTPKRLVRGSVVVDQVYAHYQHEHPEFHHPDGGQAFYLRDPLFFKADRYMATIARQMLDKDGLHLTKVMADNMEDLSREVFERAPLEFADLRASGHPMVEIDGALRYDRPPNCRRLEADELRVKSHLRYLYDPHRYRR